VPGIKQNAPELVQKLLHLLLESDNYGERRGAAYGLAGLVRGLGITALKQLEIMSTLEQAVKDKKNPRRKEGLSFCVSGILINFCLVLNNFQFRKIDFMLISRCKNNQ
jgi:hypothetical protein